MCEMGSGEESGWVIGCARCEIGQWAGNRMCLGVKLGVLVKLGR